jgi:hypothetical protein
VRGAEPIQDWLKELSDTDRRALGYDIGLVEFGWPIGMPLCRAIGGGLWEIRTSLASNRTTRVILHRGRAARAAARFYQKEPQDAGAGFGLGARPAKGCRVMKQNPHIGSSFSDFLKEEGIYEEVTAHTIKRVLAFQIEQAMKDQGLTKVEMARRMKTSRAQLDRLLDPENDKVQLDTVQRAAAAVGRKLHMELA